MKISINKLKNGYIVFVGNTIVHDKLNIDAVKKWLNNQLNEDVEQIKIETK